MPVAITRQVSSRFAECEITHIERTPIDVNLARDQHRKYLETLARLGCQVIELSEAPDQPDSVFVEDTAVILPEVAIITRPGAESRRAEIDSISRILSAYRPLVHVTDPATLDGGDVLVMGRRIYVGLSTRSNQAAIDQLLNQLNQYEYMIEGLELSDCLHLKSAVSRLDDHTLLINRDWVDPACFPGYDLVEVDPLEPFAANCLPLGERVIFPAAFPRTSRKLQEKGYRMTTVDVSELAKAEGAVTCCSLILPD